MFGMFLIDNIEKEFFKSLNKGDTSSERFDKILNILVHKTYKDGVSYQDQNQNSFYTLLAPHLSPDLIARMTRHGFDFSQMDRMGHSLMFCFNDRFDSLMKMHRKGLVPESIENGAHLFDFVDTVEKFETYVKRGLNVPERDNCGIPYLMQIQDNDLFRRYLAYHKNPNITDRHGNTPLHTITNIPKLKMLIKAGADIHAENDLGNTPVFGKLKPLAIALFKDEGADLHHRNRLGQTPYLYAVKIMARHVTALTEIDYLDIRVELKTVEVFLMEGVDPNTRDNDGNTALFYALKGGALNIVQDLNVRSFAQGLVAAGVNPTFKNNDGKMAHEFAHTPDDMNLCPAPRKRATTPNHTRKMKMRMSA